MKIKYNRMVTVIPIVVKLSNEYLQIHRENRNLSMKNMWKS